MPLRVATWNLENLDARKRVDRARKLQSPGSCRTRARHRPAPQVPEKVHAMSNTTLIILVVLALVLFGGGGGYYWTRRH